MNDVYKKISHKIKSPEHPQNFESLRVKEEKNSIIVVFGIHDNFIFLCFLAMNDVYKKINNKINSPEHS